MMRNIAVVVLVWVISSNMAYADPTCTTLVDLLVLQAKMLKTATEITANEIAKGLRPLTSPEEIAKWAANHEATAEEAKARCTQ